MNIYTQISSNKRKTGFFMVGFVLFIIAVAWAFSYAFDAGYFPLLIITPIVLISSIGGYYYSDKMVLGISGAKEVQKKDNPELYRIVENLSIGAGLPMPKVYEMDDPSPNAFATGRDPNHAVVAVTKGLLEKLDKPELEGVIAHELSHIGNYDTRLMVIVAIMAGTIVMLSHFMMRWMWWGRGGRRSSSRRDGRLQLIMMVVAIALAILAPIFAQMIKLAISRKREYLADASAALITRYPEGLARALEKISADTTPVARATNGTAHLYIDNPLREEREGGMAKFFSSLFMTHPSSADRVAALRKM